MAEKKRIAKREPLFKAVATAAPPSRRAHGTLQPEDESIIVGYYTFQSVFSVRGLKEDANLYGERIFDVNSAYFFNHGGYEFAKQFYKDAYEAAKEIVGCDEIDRMGRKTLLGRVEFTQDEAKTLKEMAKASITANTLIAKLKEQLADAKHAARIWKERYEKLWDQTYDYVQAVKQAPEQVMEFIRKVRRPNRHQSTHAKDEPER